MQPPTRVIKTALLVLGVFSLLAGAGWAAHWYFSSPRQTQAIPDPATAPGTYVNMQPWLESTEPVGAIASQLTHEKRQSTNTAVLPAHTWDRLDSLETGLDQEKRAWVRAAGLVSLHVQSTSDFVEAQGFGYYRARRLPPSRAPLYVDLDDGPSRSFTRYDIKTFKINDATAGPVTAPPPPQPGKHGTLFGLHLDGMLGFLSSGGLGLVSPSMESAQPDTGARYRPHGFADETTLQQGSTPVKNRWLVHKLELVSLLKHEHACVYESDSLPRMKERRQAKTRSLTDFERKALTALQTGDDLVSQATENRLHMLGSLRAGRQCLDCHEVERGALLGALSYELRR